MTEPLDQQESTLNFLGNDSLQQFFEEMNKLPLYVDTNTSNGSEGSPISTSNHNAIQKDGQKFFDMVQQVGGDTIWGEFFSNSTAQDRTFGSGPI